MIEISQKQRSYNWTCGTDPKFTGIRYAIMYIHGEISAEEYSEMYIYANDEGKSAMDALVLDYILNIKDVAK